MLAAATAGAAGYGWGLRSFAVDDVEHDAHPQVSPDGRRMVVSGTAPGRLDVVRRFLCSTDGARQMVLPTRGAWAGQGVAVTDHGGAAVRSDGEGLSRNWEDLSGGGPVARLLLLRDDGRLLRWDETGGELTPFAPWRWG